MLEAKFAKRQKETSRHSRKRIKDRRIQSDEVMRSSLFIVLNSWIGSAMQIVPHGSEQV